MKTEDTEVLGRELNKQDQSLIQSTTCKNCSSFVYHYNSTQYCKTETVFFIFPFLQTNITSQMWPKWRQGSNR